MLNPVVKSFAATPPASTHRSPIRRTSHTLTWPATPVGVAPLAMIVPTGRRILAVSCSTSAARMSRMNVYNARRVDGNSAVGKPFRVAFHDVSDSDVAVEAERDDFRRVARRVEPQRHGPLNRCGIRRGCTRYRMDGAGEDIGQRRRLSARAAGEPSIQLVMSDQFECSAPAAAVVTLDRQLHGVEINVDPIRDRGRASAPSDHRRSSTTLGRRPCTCSLRRSLNAAGDAAHVGLEVGDLVVDARPVPWITLINRIGLVERAVEARRVPRPRRYQVTLSLRPSMWHAPHEPHDAPLSDQRPKARC